MGGEMVEATGSRTICQICRGLSRWYLSSGLSPPLLNNTNAGDYTSRYPFRSGVRNHAVGEWEFLKERNSSVGRTICQHLC